MSEAASTVEGPQVPGRSRFYEALNVLGVYVLVVVLFAVGCAISREFLTADNLMNALRAVTLMGIVSMGLAFVTYSRHYVDLSIPGIMALSGTLAVWALQYGIVSSLAIGLAVGVLIGLINGVVIGYLRLNPIIWTLAMMSLLSGLIRWAYAGRQIYPDRATAAGRAFLAMYHWQVFGLVPLPALILVVAAAAGYFLMKGTGYGAQLKLTGSSYEVARLTGVDVRRVVATAFVICSVTSAVAGILLTSFNKVGAVYIGDGYEFKTITAVVLGGMALAGGRGNILGVIGGVMVIALMNNVMSLVRIEASTIERMVRLLAGVVGLSVPVSIRSDFTMGTFLQGIVQGVLFILVVGLHSYSLRKSGSDDA
jgi:ribose/xylose/arabinose/galactoside ABC-type transport system permease subunit